MTETLDFGMSETDADMLASMPEVRRDRARFMDRLYGQHLSTGVDKVVQNNIGQLAEEAATAKNGNRDEGWALFVIGETGAGKTRIVNRALDSLPELQATQTEIATLSPVARVVAPSPMTLLQLGQEILHAIGYPMQRNVQESAIWREVRKQLKLRGVRLIHIDEGQHMLTWQNQQEMDKLANTLKNTMQRQDWLVWFVISGLPELADFVGRYRQILRRKEILPLGSLDPSKNSKLPEWILLELVEKHAGMTLGVKTGDDVQSLVPAEFLNRLCHAAWYQFGILIDLVRSAIRQALIRDPAATTVQYKDFTNAYKVFSGCTKGQNVMTAQRWHEIDPREAIHQNRAATYTQGA